MKIIIFDFGRIDTKIKLDDYLEKELGLSRLIVGYGKNLDAFFDAYSYSDEVVFFELKNYKEIGNSGFKEYMDNFIDLLDKLKKTNPNFGYEIID